MYAFARALERGPNPNPRKLQMNKVKLTSTGLVSGVMKVNEEHASSDVGMKKPSSSVRGETKNKFQT